jgi:hypothetical protein
MTSTENASLPPLIWDGYFWTAEIVLPAWSGFQDRSGPYESRSSNTASTGRCHLSVSSPDGTEATQPTEEQHRAYAYLLEYQEEIRDAVLLSIFEEEGFDEEEEGISTIRSVEEMRTHMGLSTVHILDVVREGITYLGLSFGCDWEEEHGAGVMLHHGRIIAVGHSDSSFLEWIAEWDRDGGTRPQSPSPTPRTVEPVDDGQQTLTFGLE